MTRTCRSIALAVALTGAGATWWLAAAGAQAPVSGCQVCGGPVPCMRGHAPIRLRDRGPGVCVIDGVCAPSTPWGYNRTRWRRWPGTDAADTSRPTPLPPEYAPYEPTPPEFEDQQVAAPRPSSPQRPRPMAPVGGGVVPPPPMPPAPMPGVPNGVVPAEPPQPGAVPPVTNPFAPPEGNPFEGTSVEEPEAVKPASYEDDGPPPLPESLRLAQRSRSHELAAALAILDSSGEVRRLPTVGQQMDRAEAFPVMQASAAVFASGESVGSVEATDQGVRQAIHFEPLDAE